LSRPSSLGRCEGGPTSFFVHRIARNLKVVEVSTSYRRPGDPELIDLDRTDWRDGPSL